MEKWTQLWVQLKPDIVADPVLVMQRCEPSLERFSALPSAPQGIPIVNDDGTIEVRIFSELTVSMVKRYLEESGFEIVREQINEM